MMGYRTLLNGLQNLVVRRYAGPFWYRRHWLKKTEWMNEKELECLQLKLLRKLIKHCYKTIPFYQNIMDRNGINIASIKSLADIKQFPILTKKDILSAGKTIISSKYPRCFQRTAYTGGTTGTPMEIRRDICSIGNEHAFVRRQWDWAGIRFGDRCAYLTGRLIADTNRTDAKLYVFDPIMKELILSTYHLSEATAIDYARVMRKYNVKAIVGYPSAVCFLARVCIARSINVDLTAALTSSETLTSSMRTIIEEAFGCQVFDFYGSAERVCYIFTCEKGNYHINPDYGYTELVPVDQANPQRCRVVSTGFWSKAMPFVRYDTGDIVERSDKKCVCGRAFPVVESIEGRLADTIRTSSGREFGAAILTHLLYGANNILESQIIQEQIDAVRIEYVPAEGFSKKNLQVFQSLIAKHLPNELSVSFRKVDAVRRTSSGKVKPIVSRLL
jgi:phenylacetate-coenzyme A ligase PaaK-like adenylate-forming protein